MIQNGGVGQMKKWILVTVICFALLFFVVPPIFASSQSQSNGGPTVAHLNIQSGSQSAGDGQQLQLSVALGQETTVSFDASASTGQDLSYQWQIDGSQVNATKSFSYQLGAGSHQVTLYATDSQDETSSTSATVVVSVAGNSTEVAPVNFKGVQTTDRDLRWAYDGVDYQWHVEAPSDVAQGYNLLQWDRQVNEDTSNFYNSDAITQNDMTAPSSMTAEEKTLILADAASNNGDLTPWVNDQSNALWVSDLAVALGATAKNVGYDYFHEAEFVQAFVGNAIPYNLTAFPELPAQTLIDGGSRRDKSILLAGLLKSLGYQVSLLYFSGTSETQGHTAVGVVFSDSQVPNKSLSYYLYNNNKYYFAETGGANLELGAPSTEIPSFIFDAGH
jgi:hypothetical protein